MDHRSRNYNPDIALSLGRTKNCLSYIMKQGDVTQQTALSFISDDVTALNETISCDKSKAVPFTKYNTFFGLLVNL